MEQQNYTRLFFVLVLAQIGCAALLNIDHERKLKFTCFAANSSSRPSPITTYVTFFPKRETILSKQLSFPARKETKGENIKSYKFPPPASIAAEEN